MVPDHSELTNGCVLRITTNDASSNSLMTRDLQSTLEALGIKWLAMRNHILCMAQVMQLGLGASMTNHSVKGLTKSWEAHECDQQVGENESTNVGKSQRLREEGNAWINKVSAMRPGLGKDNWECTYLRHFERPETNLHIAENACCVDYADTWSSKPVHWLSSG